MIITHGLARRHLHRQEHAAVHRERLYDNVKDHLAKGVCIQKMLAAHALGLGAVSLGEILKNADRVLPLSLPAEMELVAVVALGHPSSQKYSSKQDVPEVLPKE